MGQATRPIIERLNGRIDEVLATRRFRTGENIAEMNNLPELDT